MSNGREKRSRKATVQTDIWVKPPRKWKPEEMGKVYECIQKYGHKDLKKLQEALPGRSEENIRNFLRTIYDTAGKFSEKHENLDSWISRTMGATLTVSPWRDSIQIAKVIKYLSIDGLLENHPLPEQCGNIDFGRAYHLIYQALMGYPTQPVNKETILFVQETLLEIIDEIKKEPSIVENVSSFLTEKLKPKIKEESSENTTASKKPEKPIRNYQRKRPLKTSDEAPSLKIVVEPVNGETKSGTQTFSVATEGESSMTILNVPVKPTTATPTIIKDEEELLQSPTYNPFFIPEFWLQEPVYLNLLKKC